jgi:hypothetical protein
MLLPPIAIQDLSTLLAVSAILLLFTAEFLPYVLMGKTLISDLKKLRILSLILGILFLASIVIEYF